MAHVPAGAIGLLFDQQFGLVANAPVYAVAAVGMIALLRRQRLSHSDGRLSGAGVGLTVLVVTVPYLGAVTSYAMWWGGLSAPGRFAVPILLLMALPASAAWAWPPLRATRAMALAALTVTAGITATLLLVDHGSLLYDVRGTAARWVAWMDPALDVPRVLPSLFRDGAAGALVRTGIWAAWLAAAWGVLVVVVRATDGRTMRARGLVALATMLTSAAAITGAAATVWRLDEARPVTAEAAVTALRDAYDVGARPWGVHYGSRTLRPADEVLPHLRLVRVPDPDGRDGDPIAWFPLVPAGRYALTVTGDGWGGGILPVVIGRHRDGEIARVETPAAGSGPVVRMIDLPVDVHSVVLHEAPTASGEAGRGAVRHVTLEPRARLGPGERAAPGRAVRARTYGMTTTYFMDEAAYVERDAFWAAGGAPADVVFVPVDGSRHVRVEVRNAPVANRLHLSSGGWSRTLELAPGETRIVDVPVVAGAALVRVLAEAGFRPSEVEPGSTDRRFLGCRLSPL
jgi:hypothetical protein